VTLGQPRLIPGDESSQLPVAADLTRPRVVDDNFARPCRLERAAVTFHQCGEVSPDRVNLACRATFSAR
jgi:hypothetical protein